MIRSKFSDVEIPEVPLHFVLFARSEEFKDRTCLIEAETGKSYTHAEFLQKIRNISYGLQQLGVKKGDVVALFSPNCPEFAMMLFAVMSVGAISTTMNPAYTVYEVKKQLDDCGAKFLYTCKELVNTALKSARQAGVKKIITDVAIPGCVPFDDLLKANGEKFDPYSVPFDPKNDVVLLPYSSGTTGLPKGVMLTHHNVAGNLIQVSHPGLANLEVTPEGFAHTIMGFLPFYHSYGLIVVLCGGLAAGNTIVTLRKFVPEVFLGAIEKFKITYVPLVPPVVVYLAKSPLVSKYDLSSVRVYACGSAPLSSETTAEFRSKTTSGPLKQGYGLTETSPVVTTPPPEGYEPGSSGVLVPNTELQIVDLTTGKALGANQNGEIWMRGPQVMKGYWKKPKQTKECIDEQGWFHTGDIGYYDEKQNVFVIDRLKELIKYKGLQVAPAELEALLLTHPSVADVAVIGVPDLAAGELPKGYIVKKPGKQLSEDDVKKFVAEHVAYFKQLRGGVEFVKAIPKSPSGKILRRELRDALKGGNKSKL